MIEACISSLREAVYAEKAGAGRLELCSALELGGLTPSIGVLEEILQNVSIPVVVMVRPRPGGFCYCPSELQCMKRDARRLLDAGAQGIVFGCLEEGGEVESNAVRAFVEIAQGRDTVFHRAFDFHRWPLRALEELIELNVRRILTSGGKETAIEGAELISQLVIKAKGRIQILPGGGVRAANILALLEQTGCSDVHVGASVVLTDGSVQHRPELNLVDSRIVQGNSHRELDIAALEAVLAQAGNK